MHDVCFLPSNNILITESYGGRASKIPSNGQSVDLALIQPLNGQSPQRMGTTNFTFSMTFSAQLQSCSLLIPSSIPT